MERHEFRLDVKIWSLEDYELQTTLSCDGDVRSLEMLEIDGKACLANGHLGRAGIKLWKE